MNEIACFPCLTARCGHPDHARRPARANLAGGNLAAVTYCQGSALCED